MSMTMEERQVDVLTAKVQKLRKALEFYARPTAYNGSNQRNDGSDPFTPEDAPYIIDVMRDNGETARKALGLPNPPETWTHVARHWAACFRINP